MTAPKMTAKLTEALDEVGRCVRFYADADAEDSLSVIKSVLSDLAESEAGLRAERERLGEQLFREKIIFKNEKELSHKFKACAEKAEAELARWKPLIEAVEKAEMVFYVPKGRTWIEGTSRDAIIKAALSCREEGK